MPLESQTNSPERAVINDPTPLAAANHDAPSRPSGHVPGHISAPAQPAESDGPEVISPQNRSPDIELATEPRRSPSLADQAATAGAPNQIPSPGAEAQSSRSPSRPKAISGQIFCI
jgi:hypothetical protein